jgi:hypothetical protein
MLESSVYSVGLAPQAMMDNSSLFILEAVVPRLTMTPIVYIQYLQATPKTNERLYTIMYIKSPIYTNYSMYLLLSRKVEMLIPNTRFQRAAG